MKLSPVPKSQSRSLKKEMRAGGSACQKTKSLQKRQLVPLHLLTHLAFSVENGSQNFYHEFQNNKLPDKPNLLNVKHKRKMSKDRQKQKQKDPKRKQILMPKIKNFFNSKLQKRLQSYYLFLSLAKSTLNAPLGKSYTENRRYTVYIGKGNNSKLIKKLFYSRHWWSITNDLKSQNINLIWTQWSKKSIFNQLQNETDAQKQKERQKCRKPKKEDQRYEKDQNIHYQSSKSFINKIICQQQSKKTTVFNQFNYLLRTKQRDSSKSAFVETQYDVRNYLNQQQSQVTNPNRQSHRQPGPNSTKQSSKHTPQAQSSKNPNDQKYKQELPSYYPHRYHKKRHITITCNHVQGHQNITDKKNLLACLQQYCLANDQNCFDIVPLSFNVVGTQGDFSKLDEIEKTVQTGKEDRKAMWIMKPGQKSNRGNGIKVFKRIQQIKQHLQKNKQQDQQKYPSRTYIIQKYIYPALYHRRKFDIRCFVLLVASPHISAYFFNDGYLRTCSKEFKDRKIDDKFMHLTNDAIQKKGTDYGKFQKGNKITFQQYQSFLDMFQKKQINFKKEILPKLKLMAAKSIAAGSRYFNQSKRSYSFQILGYDFMIDQQYRPWLIEVNTNPCIETGCPVLDGFIPYAVNNAIKIAVDSVFKPPKVNEWHLQEIITFPEKILENNKYQLIFQQQYVEQ